MRDDNNLHVHYHMSVVLILQFLPKNVHLVCVDMPGHEGTSRTSAVDYSIEGQVRRINQVRFHYKVTDQMILNIYIYISRPLT